jgi:N-acetylglucosaminyltransferase
MWMLVATLVLYVVLAVPYAWLQRRYAESSQGSAPAQRPGSYRPDVDVIVPCYNEEPGLLAACLRSLREQDYRGRVKVWVVDDGSSNREALRPVLQAEVDRSWRVVYLDGHHGKRVAQDAALHAGHGEVVLTIDSDTTIEPDGISRIVDRLRDPRVGAVTGDVRPSNPDATWLTRLIDTRYRLLFERERAAQGAFGAVLCCAGPFSAYRRAAVERIWPSYVDQRFLGSRRTFGDDLKLTNLVLASGWRSHYEPRARAATNVPTTLRRYVRQQLRWNRSFYRELPRILRLLPGRSRFLVLDIAGQTLLPLLLTISLVVAAAITLLDRSRLPWTVAALALMALASFGLVPASAPGRRFAVRYGLVFVGLLLPTRLWAACTLFRNHWGTRNPPGQRSGLASSRWTLRSATWLPFSLYSQTASSSSLAASAWRPQRRSTSARSTCASAREST